MTKTNAQTTTKNIRSFPNRRAGACLACGVAVPEQGGRCFRRNGSGDWAVSCLSSVCASKLGLAGAKPTSTKRVLTADGKVFTPKEPKNLPLLRSFPGARWDHEGFFWQVSLDMADRERVLELADKLKLDVAPELREKPKDLEGLRLACVAAGMFAFQVRGILWLSRRKRALLADDMGLGKTAQSLMSLPAAARAIVICPASVKLNWAAEVRRWRKDLEPVVLQGRKSFRAPRKGEVVILNFAILPAAPKKGEKLAIAPELVGCNLVVDEAAFVQNYRAARTRSVRAISGACASTWFLTGTPLMNHPYNLWGMLDAGQMARDVFGSWRKFTQLFNAEPGRWGGWEFGTPEPEVPERLRRVMLRRTKAEVLPDLPPVTTTDLVVNGLDKKLKKDLDTAWAAWCGSVGDVKLASTRAQALAMGISWDIHGDHDWDMLMVYLDALIDAEDFPTPEGIKLIETDSGRTLSDGQKGKGPGALPPFERFSELRERLACVRIPALLDLVAQYESSETPVVVFSAHREPVETLAKREGWVHVIGEMPAKQRHENVEKFQRGECKGIACTITAAGIGLTLTRSSHVIFVDQDWRPAMNSQATDRVRRIGQEADAINVVRMVSNHPLDQRVLELLSTKQRLIEAAVEATIQVAPPKPQKAPSSPFKQESEAEQQARAQAVKEAEAAVAKAQQAKKVAYILKGEQARTKDVPELELTPEVRKALKGAFEYMLSVCDGAVSKDNHGFNKPDAIRAQLLLDFDLNDDNAARAAERMLVRYSRQLKGRFPILFTS